MPRIAILLTCIACVLLNGCAHVPVHDELLDKEKNAQPIRTQESLDRLVEMYDGDFAGLTEWINYNITYCNDFTGEYNTAFKVYYYGKGSCVGYSLFMEYMVNRWGVQCKVMTIYAPDYAHTICVFPDRYFSSDGWVYLDYNYDNNTEIAKAVRDDATGYDMYHTGVYISIK